MQTVVGILMFLVCFNFMLKQSYSKRWAVGAITIVLALFVGMMWPYAIEQSKTQIADWLANPALMLDTSVILSIEVCTQMAFCMLAVHMLTGGIAKTRTLWAYRILRWFPGFLIFPVLFSLLVMVIFSFPGKSFATVAWITAAVVLVAIPLGTIGLRWLLPEKELRLELLFITNALTAILGIVATVNGRTAVSGISDIDWTALAGIVVMVLVGGIAGIIIRRFKMRKLCK